MQKRGFSSFHEDFLCDDIHVRTYDNNDLADHFFLQINVPAMYMSAKDDPLWAKILLASAEKKASKYPSGLKYTWN